VPQPWNSVATSADGSKLIAATGYNVYLSTDSGTTWAPTGPNFNDFITILSSSDGNKLFAWGSGVAYSSSQQTTTGTGGWLQGDQYEAVDLQYIGNNLFTVISHEGAPTAQ